MENEIPHPKEKETLEGIDPNKTCIACGHLAVQHRLTLDPPIHLRCTMCNCKPDKLITN